MALRKILNKSDEILHKVCKPVTEFDDKLGQLLDDMTETLKNANGVGLAGPQVAKLRRVVVIIIDDKLRALQPRDNMAERGKAESSGGLSFMPERVGLCYKTYES